MLDINCQKHDIVRITLAGVVEERMRYISPYGRSIVACLIITQVPPTVRLWSPTFYIQIQSQNEIRHPNPRWCSSIKLLLAI